ncbi:hypothetical protein BD94_3763 [Elizabethkingia anophelis NUHP1]|uniref:Uncharacterized protein n=1 Tax=Elizabethkingia anophelis NUHP1 TaxID=1338011 RepID=A0A077EM21_9FLAO|nr:hypothetical protein BD94_3763 [Elizabethkingia anophelis NUHP1]
MIQYIPILLKQQNYSFSFTIPNQIVTKNSGNYHSRNPI